MGKVSMFLARYSNTNRSLGEQEMGTRAAVKVFPQFTQVLPNFHTCFYNSIETQRKCFLFLSENTARKRKGIAFSHASLHSTASAGSMFLLSYGSTTLKELRHSSCILKKLA